MVLILSRLDAQSSIRVRDASIASREALPSDLAASLDLRSNS